MVLPAYADDVVVLIRNQKDVNRLETITQKFSVVSSARLNWDKSEGLAVGKNGVRPPVSPSKPDLEERFFSNTLVFM